jgi:hypothetical protein
VRVRGALQLLSLQVITVGYVRENGSRMFATFGANSLARPARNVRENERHLLTMARRSVKVSTVEQVTLLRRKSWAT